MSDVAQQKSFTLHRKERMIITEAQTLLHNQCGVFPTKSVIVGMAIRSLDFRKLHSLYLEVNVSDGRKYRYNKKCKSTT